jgi:hypothetical protein
LVAVMARMVALTPDDLLPGVWGTLDEEPAAAALDRAANLLT